MAKYYIASFTPDGKGGYTIMFPDFPEIASEGYDLDDAMIMAEDALKISIEEYIKEGRPIPTPSSAAVARKNEQDFLAEFNLPCKGESIYPPIKAPDFDNTPVRISISIAKNTLAALDRKAKVAGLTRSGYIAHMVNM